MAALNAKWHIIEHTVCSGLRIRFHSRFLRVNSHCSHLCIDLSDHVADLVGFFDLRPFTYLEHCMLVPQNLISGFSRFPALSTVYTYKVLHWKFCLWVLFFYINQYYQLINYLGIPFVSVPSFIFFSQVFIHIIYILSTRCIWELKPSDHIFFILVCLLIFWLTMERS